MLTLSGAAEMEEKKQEQIMWAATGFAADNIDFPSMALGYGDETYPNGSVTTTRRLALIFAGNYYYDMRYFVDINFMRMGHLLSEKIVVGANFSLLDWDGMSVTKTFLSSMFRISNG